MKNKEKQFKEIPEWYFNHFSKEQIAELTEFKKEVTKAFEEKNSKEIRNLVKRATKIKREMSQDYDNLYFRKSFIKIIYNNPLYLNMPIDEIRKLLK